MNPPSVAAFAPNILFAGAAGVLDPPKMLGVDAAATGAADTDAPPKIDVVAIQLMTIDILY